MLTASKTLQYRFERIQYSNKMTHVEKAPPIFLMGSYPGEPFSPRPDVSLWDTLGQT